MGSSGFWAHECARKDRVTCPDIVDPTPGLFPAPELLFIVPHEVAMRDRDEGMRRGNKEGDGDKKVIFVRVSVTVLLLLLLLHIYQKQLVGRKHFFQFTVPHFNRSLKEVKAGTWKQKTKWKLWQNTAYWLVPHGFLSLLYYTIQDYHTRGGGTNSELGPPPSISNKKKSHIGLLIYQSDGRGFSIEGFFFPKWV